MNINISQSIINSKHKPALIPFIVAGFPDINTTINLIRLFNEKKCSVIELGIPFSDPLADGAVIQKASKDSLEKGITLDVIFKMISEIISEISMPIIIFTYYNPVLVYGVENFVKQVSKCGCSGIIIPDLPVEEAENLRQICNDFNVNMIMLVAPTSGEKRTKLIAENSSGFVYLVSSTGVTGIRNNFSEKLTNCVQNIKKYTKLPVAVGFGISKPEHLAEIKKTGANAVIIGSAIVKILEENRGNQEVLIKKVEEFIENILIY